MPTVLIAGGTGFIGSHITRAFHESGWRVILFGPPGPANLLDGLLPPPRRIDASITDAKAVFAAIEETVPEVVISAAAYNADAAGLLATGEAHADDAIAVNAIGLKNVLEAARLCQVQRVIWTGSVVAYGPPALYGNLPVTETDLLRPHTVYGLTKALAEQFLRFYRDVHGLDATALRLPLVFGPGRWYGGVLGTLFDYLDPAATPRPMELTDAPFDLVYVRDVARCALMLAEADKPLRCAYNLPGFTTGFPDLVDAVERVRRQGPLPVAYKHEEMAYPLMSGRMLGKTLGFKCRYGLQNALDDMLAQTRPSMAQGIKA